MRETLYCSFVIAMVFIAGCTSEDESGYPKNSKWIGDDSEIPAADSLFYLESRAPLFRKQFFVADSIESARLVITSAGYYNPFLNGEKIGNVILDPAWTDFSKRIYFREYDILNLLLAGENCIGVTLGNGFYNPLPMKMWGHLNLRNTLNVGNPRFIAVIIISYYNGEKQEIVSDSTWKFTQGALVRNNVYLGAEYNSNYEIKGWNLPGFDDSKWKNAILTNGPGGELMPAVAPPVVVVDEIIPEAIYQVDEKIIVDMGVNFTGTYRIEMRGEKGDKIGFRFGERVYENGEINPMTTVAGQIKKEGVGGPGAPAIAWQYDAYIFGSDSIVTFSPDFTFHTYRYMEISGLSYMPVKEEIRGLFISTELDQNSFDCSSDILNSIQESVVRTFRSNLVGVQSDCAAREKFGYGGDLQATGEAFIYNFNMQQFYRKTVYDWIDAINDSIFVDTAPYVGINYCGLSWESAFLITQYYLFIYYNDIPLISELYEFDLEWMEKAARIHPDGIVDSGLSDHEALESVPVELTGTSHYLQCARIMKEFALIMDDSMGFEKFSLLEERLSSVITENFLNNSAIPVENKQTLYADLLAFNLVPESRVKRLSDSLVKYVESGPGGHFTTGIFGTKYVLSALSESGNTSLVYEIVNSTDYPGWGYMMKNGATTIWETWKESDNTYSNCHPMFGSVSEWFYRYLAGIKPLAGYPGFSKFSLEPGFPSGLDYVNCSYNSPYGTIVSNWERDGNNKIICSVTIPEGSSAIIDLPLNLSRAIEVQNHHNIQTSITFIDGVSNKFEIGGGSYRISFSLD